MRTATQPAAAREAGRLPRLFAAVFGAFLGLALLKFGNPPIMEKYVSRPANGYEFVLNSPWPIAWAYGLLGLVTVLGLFTANWRASLSGRDGALCRPPVLGLFIANWRASALLWLLSLPLAWFIWQSLAATQTVDPALSRPTLAHFAACVVCFYLGFFGLSRTDQLGGFWVGLSCGLVLVLASGWEQHFGGLEATRQYFYLYHYSELKELPPEYLKKLSSTRIFGTLFYPNALAGALLLLLPVVLGAIGQARERFTLGARSFLTAVVASAGLACLYWSGSKGGWLLMLFLGVVTLLRLPVGSRFKAVVLGLVLIGGLAGFFWKYSAFFQRGATSVGARFDYWRAALQTLNAKPLFGTGPGTFSVPYQKIKRPESEMARLVHNDYLEQATDSGLPGFVAYVLLVGGTLGYAARGLHPRAGSEAHARDPISPAEPAARPKRRPERDSSMRQPAGWWDLLGTADLETFLIWLGTMGWALQSCVEFPLYIPALAWPAFAFLGLLLARARKSLGQRSGSPLTSGPA